MAEDGGKYLFEVIVKDLYDKNKFNDAQKECDYFLEKHSNHVGKFLRLFDTPESKAFNCLIMNAHGDKIEAGKQIKTILMKNMKNFTVW